MIDPITSCLIEIAIKEDIGSGDVTTSAIIDDEAGSTAEIYAKEDLVFCGSDVLSHICNYAGISLVTCIEEGSSVNSGAGVARLEGKLARLLTFERVILNFLQRLSGVATETRNTVQLIGDLKVEIRDTRKTTPGFRTLQKHAVKCGGGANHRVGLFDAFLIKNNHIDGGKYSVAETVERCRKYNPELLVEIEVRNSTELEQALSVKPDWILLDNFLVKDAEKAISQIRNSGTSKIEISGNITKETILNYANLLPDAISLGALTHSYQSVDMSMRIPA